MIDWILLSSLLLSHLVLEDPAKEEASQLLKELVERGNTPCPKCFQKDLEANFIAFISFSVPLESWKALSWDLEKVGGVFVLRGLPENSFRLLSEKVLELKKAGVNAPILIDPDAYERYQIAAVPAFILAEERDYDKVVGNIPVRTALQMFHEKGALPKTAEKMLGKVEGKG